MPPNCEASKAKKRRSSQCCAYPIVEKMDVGSEEGMFDSVTALVVERAANTS